MVMKRDDNDLARRWALIMLTCMLLFFGVTNGDAIESRTIADPITVDAPWVAQASPAVSVTASPSVLSIPPGAFCYEDCKVRLSANAAAPKNAQFTWTVTAGRLRGKGRNVTWDLSGVRQGDYTATVEVNDGSSHTVTGATTLIIEAADPPPCPTISVSCPSEIGSKQPLTFEAHVAGGNPDGKPTFTWTLSAGKIISGKGTSKIVVDVTKHAGWTITATVLVGGFNPKCSRAASCTTSVAASVPTPSPSPPNREVKQTNPVRSFFSWVGHGFDSLFGRPRPPVISDPPVVLVRASPSVITGRITGEGHNVTWDLNGVAEGAYTATVEVNDGNQLTANDRTTVTIAVCSTCDPPRPPCPTVSVSCPSVVEPKQPITFQATVTGGEPEMKPTYTWTVTAGKIISGQGTSKIAVDISEVAGKSITATVTLGGADPSCANTASCTILGSH